MAIAIAEENLLLGPVLWTKRCLLSVPFLWTSWPTLLLQVILRLYFS